MKTTMAVSLPRLFAHRTCRLLLRCLGAVILALLMMHLFAPHTYAQDFSWVTDPTSMFKGVAEGLKKWRPGVILVNLGGLFWWAVASIVGKFVPEVDLLGPGWLRKAAIIFLVFSIVFELGLRYFDSL